MNGSLYSITLLDMVEFDNEPSGLLYKIQPALSP